MLEARSDDVDTERVCDPLDGALSTSSALTCTESPWLMERPFVSMVTDEPDTLVGQVDLDWFVVTSVRV